MYHGPTKSDGTRTKHQITVLKIKGKEAVIILPDGAKHWVPVKSLQPIAPEHNWIRTVPNRSHCRFCRLSLCEECVSKEVTMLERGWFYGLKAISYKSCGQCYGYIKFMNLKYKKLEVTDLSAALEKIPSFKKAWENYLKHRRGAPSIPVI